MSKEATRNENNSNMQRNFLSTLNVQDLKKIKVSIQQDVNNSAASTTLQRNLDDPSSIVLPVTVLHHKNEGKCPIFSRSRMVMNVTENMEERTIIRSTSSPKHNKDYSREFTNGSPLPSTSKDEPIKIRKDCKMYNHRSHKDCNCFNCLLRYEKFSTDRPNQISYSAIRKNTFHSYPKMYSRTQNQTNSSSRKNSKFSHQTDFKFERYSWNSYYQSDSRSSNENSDYSENSNGYWGEKLADDYYYHYGAEDFLRSESMVWSNHAFAPFMIQPDLSYSAPESYEMPSEPETIAIEVQEESEIREDPDSTQPDL